MRVSGNSPSGDALCQRIIGSGFEEAGQEASIDRAGLSALKLRGQRDVHCEFPKSWHLPRSGTDPVPETDLHR